MTRFRVPGSKDENHEYTVEDVKGGSSVTSSGRLLRADLPIELEPCKAVRLII